MIRHSATLAVNERVQAKRAAGEKVVHLGFGEAGIPLHPLIGRVLADSAHRTEYAPVAGTPEAREAAAGYFTRRGLPTAPGRVLLAPGSKALLFALLTVLPGDVVLPKPSWVSYAAQAALAGKRVLGVPIPAEAGGVPDPDLLERAVITNRAEGGDPRVLILTLPDNPTGTLASAGLVRAVCEVAERHGLTIVSDEIYRDLCHGSLAVHSPALELPERTIVTGGLSKSMALGGYRIGFARLPDVPWADDVHAGLVGVASEIWSSLPGPMHPVAVAALTEPAELRAHVEASARLHGAVVAAVRDEFTDAGALCRSPQGGFYLYPDFEPKRKALAAKGINTGEQLAEHLLDRHGVGVLAGAEFGDDPSALRFRVATSLLYGEDAEQRWAALRGHDPVALPWISGALGQLRTALGELIPLS